MTDRDGLQNYYRRDRSYSRDRCNTTINMTIGKKIINCKITMKEIDPIVGIDLTVGINHKIIVKEIGPIAETDHIVETDQGVTTKEIDHKATTTKMTIEMSIRRKIIGISKIRDIKKSIKTITKTHMTRITIEIVTKIKTKAETNIEMTAMIWVEVGLERNLAHMMKGRFVTDQS